MKGTGRRGWGRSVGSVLWMVLVAVAAVALVALLAWLTGIEAELIYAKLYELLAQVVAVALGVMLGLTLALPPLLRHLGLIDTTSREGEPGR